MCELGRVDSFTKIVYDTIANRVNLNSRFGILVPKIGCLRPDTIHQNLSLRWSAKSVVDGEAEKDVGQKF